MPGLKVPEDLATFSDSYHYEENYKTESLSSRSSSPKSVSETDYSVSESSESPEGSVISDSELQQAERIESDLDNMKITEIQAEEMMKEGVDMRHVLQAAWKLKPKLIKKFKKGKKLNGSAVLELLNFAKYDEREEEDQSVKLSRAWALYEKKINRGKGTRAPPGFEHIDTIIEKQSRESSEARDQVLVSYANGTNTLNLATKPMIIQDVTVSCVIDTCRAFVQQTQNPTFVGLKNMEEEMMVTYNMEQSSQLMRPIAHGSVVAVNTDDKWYRCQVVSYDATCDTCEVKFVDHGGYTTVAANNLRQLKSQFLRLPFQAIEVYFAHMNPANHEIQIDIASEILFNQEICIQLIGTADDGLPMVEAYYYDGDYLRTFNQEVMDTCMIDVPASLLTTEVSEAGDTEPCSDETETISETTSDSGISSTDDVSSPIPTPMYTEYTPVHHVQPAPPAYIYTDEAGYQHVYYLTGPYVIMPCVPDMSQLQLEDESVVLAHPEPEPVKEVLPTSHSYDFINKPYEEWTQEDYARYYGDC